MTSSNVARCTLFTGPSGLHAVDALDKLADYVQRQQLPRPVILKLESFMTQLHTDRYPGDPSARLVNVVGGFQNLLLEPKEYLRILWRESVDRAMSDLVEDDAHVFICMHAVFHHTGSRDFFPCADVDHLIEALDNRGLAVGRVVTLIDDIFDMWSRLAEPRQLFDGTSDVVQAVLDLVLILSWRSMEIFAAEEIAARLGVPHYLLALKHPLSVAYDLIFTSKTPAYIAHPISEIRKLEQRGQQSEAADARREIDDLTRLLLASNKVVPFFPTTIDEFIVASEPPGTESYVPRLLPRWPTRPDQETLFTPTEGPQSFADEAVERALVSRVLDQLSSQSGSLTGDELRQTVDPSDSITFPLARRDRSTLAPEARVTQRAEQSQRWEEIASDVGSASLPFSFLPLDEVLFDAVISVQEFVQRIERLS